MIVHDKKTLVWKQYEHSFLKVLHIYHMLQTGIQNIKASCGVPGGLPKTN